MFLENTPVRNVSQHVTKPIERLPSRWPLFAVTFSVKSKAKRLPVAHRGLGIANDWDHFLLCNRKQHLVALRFESGSSGFIRHLFDELVENTMILFSSGVIRLGNIFCFQLLLFRDDPANCSFPSGLRDVGFCLVLFLHPLSLARVWHLLLSGTLTPDTAMLGPIQISRSAKSNRCRSM